MLETILEWDVLPVAIPDFPTVRRMTLGKNSPMLVPSLHAGATVEQQQKMFTDSWDLLFIEYSAAVYFHTCETKINSWTTQSNKMRGSMPPKYEVREVLKTLEKAGLESKLPIYDDGRLIVEEGHLALKDEMKFSTRKHLAPYGLQEVELQQEGRKLDAAGVLYVPLTEYKVADPTTPSPLPVGTPGDRRSLPVENRFTDALESDQAESGEGESMDETLSEAGEEMEVGNTPDKGATKRDFSPVKTRELLQDLSGDDWANTATPLLGSPRKNLELPLASRPSNMGMVLLTNEVREKYTFEGNKGMFLSTLDEEAWQSFLSEFNQSVENKAKVDDFKEELWDTVVKFGELVLIGTGLDEKVRKKLLEKMIGLRTQSRIPGATHEKIAQL